MARDEAPPFARGETYNNGGIIDTANLGGVNLEGKEFVFEVNAPDAPSSLNDPSGRPVRVKIVRNTSAINLLPSRLAHYDTSLPGVGECHVDGYTFQITDRVAGVIDEFLPPAGVPPNDLFYLVQDGPTIATLVGTGNGTVGVGTRLVPGVGTGRTTADAGKVNAQDLTQTGSTLSNQILNQIGYSDVVNTTAGSNFAVLIHTSHC